MRAVSPLARPLLQCNCVWRCIICRQNYSEAPKHSNEGYNCFVQPIASRHVAVAELNTLNDTKIKAPTFSTTLSFFPQTSFPERLAKMDISVDLYESLPLEKETDIRLLTLNRGAGIDQITCSLVKADLDIDLLRYDPLDNNIRYEALSYCWGSPEITDHITINNRSVEIRINLWWALIHLREVHNDRILWVDALCINQNDTRERNHQVGLMG